MFEQFLQFIAGLDSYWIFLFVFLSALIENIFPPYPGDTAIAFSGYLAGKGVASLLSVALASYLGALTGAVLMYFLGEKFLLFLRKYFGRYAWTDFLKEENLQKSHKWMEKYGVWIVIFSRFSAGIRFFVAIVAGIIRMNFLLFILAFSLATVLWNFILIFFSYRVGENWQKVIDFLRLYNYAIMTILILLAGIWIFYRWKNRKEV